MLGNRQELVVVAVTSVAIMGCIIADTMVAYASSKYEEMGPLAVHSFQTSRPDVIYRAACNPERVAIVTAAAEEPPAHLFVAAPSAGGRYPVLLFKHGFAYANCAYSQLLLHIASYGYVIVAPQAPSGVSEDDCSDEIEQTIQVEEWLPGNLSKLLAAAMPEQAEDEDEASAAPAADVEKLMISGHGRGGKVALAIASGLLSSSSRGQQDRDHDGVPRFVGLFAFDPVDAPPSKPAIAGAAAGAAVAVPFPVFVLGTGLGADGSLLHPSAPCAPPCCSHAALARAARAPVVYSLLAPGFGHLDFLDDSVYWSGLVCKGAAAGKAPLRSASAALLLAFFRSLLSSSPAPLLHAISDASIRLERPPWPPSSAAADPVFCAA